MGSHKPEFAEIPGLTPPANGTAMASTAGTATAPESASKTNEDLNIHILQPQDAVLITFSDLPTPWMPLSDRIKEDGTVTLPLNQTIHAAGRTTSALQEEIRGHYVPKYFVNMTVVVTLQEEKRFYYVDGEVKMPSRQVWMGPTTVLKAIASANGFTDFARKGSVVLTRANGSKMTINCRRAISHPELDMPVYPNDKIWVPRRIF
jgi:polysaccharide export outer membrane protein